MMGKSEWKELVGKAEPSGKAWPLTHREFIKKAGPATAHKDGLKGPEWKAHIKVLK